MTKKIKILFLKLLKSWTRHKKGIRVVRFDNQRFFVHQVLGPNILSSLCRSKNYTYIYKIYIYLSALYIYFNSVKNENHYIQEIRIWSDFN